MARKPGRPEDGFQPDVADLAQRHPHGDPGNKLVDLSEFDAEVSRCVAAVEVANFKLQVAKARLKVASDEETKDEALEWIERYTREARQGLAAECRARAARARARGLSSS